MAQGSDPSHAPTNHIVFGWDNQILAAPFDLRKLEVRGVPIPLVEGVRMNFGAGAPSADYTLSRNGTLVYVAGRKPERRLVWASRAGRLDPLPLPSRGYLFPALSPDQDRVAVTIAEAAGRDVWIGDLPRGTLSRLTTDRDAMFSLWTPDAKRVLYTSSKSGQYNVFWKSADGSGAAEPLTQSGNPQRATSVSPDGRFLLFNDLDPVSLMDVWVLRLDGDRKPVPLLKTAANELMAEFSPDGRWVSYDSDESGRFEVYVQAYPGPGEKKQISTEGGRAAHWNPNGSELFYTAGEQVMSVTFEEGPRLHVGKPRPLFRIGPPAEPLQALQHYGVAAHGERFLFAEHDEPASAEGRLQVVANWFEELRRRVPAR
jgi:dipeptidyl aminopeptidase/acylaminoacyl peptidase